MSESQPELTQLKTQLKGLTKLLEITRDLAAQHNLDRILETVTSGACDALECERASLFLYDDEKQELYTKVVTELEIEEIRSPIDQGITGWVARRLKIANIPNPEVDARWNSAVDRETGFQTRNILAAPVISAHNNQLIGVLELINRLNGSFDGFDEQVLQAFADHAAIALERAMLLAEAKRANELQISANVGHTIQAGFMPEELPEISGYEIAAWWQPADAVGGDYYDVIPLSNGRLGLIVADVSGHGIGASLIMASFRAMLHVLLQTSASPDKILGLLSETIMPDLKKGRFITFLMMAFDWTNHSATFVNAGHGPAIHFRCDEGIFEQIAPTGLPVGFTHEYSGSLETLSAISPGDILILATDGAIELRNEQGEMYGRERLERLVEENSHLSAADLVSVVSRSISEFCPDQNPPDDITLLILKRSLSGGN